MENQKKSQAVNPKLTNVSDTTPVSQNELNLLILEKLNSIEKSVSSQNSNDSVRLDILSGRLDNVSDMTFRVYDRVQILSFELSPLIGVLNAIKRLFFFSRKK